MPKRKVPTSGPAEPPSKKKVIKPGNVALSNLRNRVMKMAKTIRDRHGPLELTIKCGQYLYSVSLLQACSNSAFIKREYGWGSNKKSYTLVLEDDPGVVEDMIRYLHWGKSYVYHALQPFSNKMFKKRKLATKSRINTRSKSMAIQSKSPGQPVPSACPKISFDILSSYLIRLYALAKRLEAEGMIKICLDDIMRALSVDMDRASLMRALKEMHTCFGESDQLLQHTIVSFVRKNLLSVQAHKGKGGRKSTLKDALDSTASFCRDLSLELVKGTPQRHENDAIDNDDEDNGEGDGNDGDDPNDKDWTP